MAQSLNGVIDISHHNANPDFQQAAASGIVGVIHKATQGLTYKDPMYTTNRQKALDAGLLWRAYHFGAGGNGAGQVDFFLGTVNPGPDTLLVLDHEPNTQGATLSLDDASAFVDGVNTKAGRFPAVFGESDQLSNHRLKRLAHLKEGTRRKFPPGGARTHDRVFRSSLKAAVLESDRRR